MSRKVTPHPPHMSRQTATTLLALWLLFMQVVFGNFSWWQTALHDLCVGLLVLTLRMASVHQGTPGPCTLHGTQKHETTRAGSNAVNRQLQNVSFYGASWSDTDRDFRSMPANALRIHFGIARRALHSCCIMSKDILTERIHIFKLYHEMFREPVYEWRTIFDSENKASWNSLTRWEIII